MAHALLSPGSCLWHFPLCRSEQQGLGICKSAWNSYEKQKTHETIVEGWRLRTVHTMERTCSRLRCFREKWAKTVTPTCRCRCRFTCTCTWMWKWKCKWTCKWKCMCFLPWSCQRLRVACMHHVTRMIRGIGLVLFSTNSQTFEWIRS